MLPDSFVLCFRKRPFLRSAFFTVFPSSLPRDPALAGDTDLALAAAVARGVAFFHKVHPRFAADLVFAALQADGAGRAAADAGSAAAAVIVHARGAIPETSSPVRPGWSASPFP